MQRGLVGSEMCIRDRVSRLEDNFIHYVGLIIPVSDEYEYIITDKNGAIDSISRSLSYRLGLNPKAVLKAVGAVSYTHLTLPTILLVQISVVAVSLTKKITILLPYCASST
eukprot:TRINITY_DN32665_c0_g1_i1.p2 TRINITY_DN32665_c0_g1~~TRINITY_DN32665_c0_g1_i1.p2  ORF type:complete len:111 (-),score=22.99 TRINITY_DN32665_c0_g1_i1:22-354(-)